MLLKLTTVAVIGIGLCVLPAYASDPFERIASGDIERVSICGYRGLGAEQIPLISELAAACDAGRQSTVMVEFTRYSEVAEILAGALRTARRIEGERNSLGAGVQVIVRLRNGEEIRFFVLSNRELECGDVRVSTVVDDWLERIGRVVCESFGCSELPREGKKTPERPVGR